MSHPTLPMIILGRTLLRLRREAGLTQVQAAKRCRFSDAKLSYIENGKQTVSMFDVAGMCEVYGAPEDLKKELIRMSDQADKPGWWESYTVAMLKDFSVLLELEATCGGHHQYEGELIPGLLQTKAYATAIHTLDRHNGEEYSTKAVELRLKRQQRFWSRNILPEMCFIIHESAVMRPVCGGKGNDEQKAKLLELGKTVDIRVVPQSVGGHPSIMGAYLILTAGLPGISDVVYMEAINGCTYDEKNDSLSVYRRYFEATREVSVPIGEFLS